MESEARRDEVFAKMSAFRAFSNDSCISLNFSGSSRICDFSLLRSWKSSTCKSEGFVPGREAWMGNTESEPMSSMRDMFPTSDVLAAVRETMRNRLFGNRVLKREHFFL